MFLGFVLATTTIKTYQKGSVAVALIVPIIALGIPIADTFLAMLRRAARGAPLFAADRGHIHHRLLKLGLSQRQAVMVLYASCLVLGGLAVAMLYATPHQAIWFLGALALVALVALRKLGFLNWSSATRLIVERRRNAEMRNAVKRVGTVLRTAQTEDDVLHALLLGAAAVGAARVSLKDTERAEAALQGFGQPKPLGEVVSARFSVYGERPGAKQIILTWNDGRSEVDRDTEIAVETLCQHLSAALERVEVERSGTYPLSGSGAA
jgi:UDP-GlcNAc:undecaprenyl-phosphate GlcNAc-1-phosphate transferase